jgi:hypothetical protein
MFARIYKYNHELNSYDVIKFIAIIAMIIDHIGFYFIVENRDYFRALGRLAAPFFFFVTGYVSKYHLKPSIFIYGILLTGIYFYLGYDFSINILIVFFAIKWVLDHWDPSKANPFTLVIVFFLLYFFYPFTRSFIDYGLLGFAYAFCGRLLAMNTNPILTGFLLASTLLIQLVDRIVFNNNLSVALLVSVVVILLFLIMSLFQYKVFSAKPLIKNSMLIFSRYSLEIYFWHLLFFEMSVQLM